jgi:hypothetical protein
MAMHAVTSEDAAQAPADLMIEVYTSPTRTFLSAITPEGPGGVGRTGAVPQTDCTT